MKKINLKAMIISTIICLLPMLLGLAFYNKLPNELPVHFDINNNADRYASKNFALFAIPAILALLQILCCVINDINAHYKGKSPKIELIYKSIIPLLSIVIYTITICIGLGYVMDVRRIICFVSGIIFIATGNYLPKINLGDLNSIRLSRVAQTEKTWRKVSKMSGYGYIVIGFLLILSIFLSSIYSVIAICLIIALSIFTVVYSIILTKKN